MGNKQNKNENIHHSKNICIEKKNILDKNEDIKNLENKDKAKYKFNILFIGESEVGTKTSLINRIKEGKFIQLEKHKEEKCDYLYFEKEDKNIILYLIDTNGKKENRNGSNIYFQNADCIIMGYDVTNKQSFNEIVDYWYKKVQELSKTNLIYLLGNKIDLKSEIKVKEKEVKIFADSNKIKYFPISVKNDININEFLIDLKTNLDIDKHIMNNNGINEIIYGNPSKKKYKIVFIGGCAIGSKSTLINLLIFNKFDYNYPICSYLSKTITLKNNDELILDLWDTAGQEKFRSINKLFYFYCDVVVIGFDVTRKDTFDDATNYWYHQVKENSYAEIIYMIGNKIDLINDRNVPRTEARNFCKEANLRYFEISCLTSAGIQEFLDDLTNELIKR